LIAQNVRNRGLSRVFSELLTHRDGNEIFVRPFPELAEKSVGQLVSGFERAVLIGVLRKTETGFSPLLNPPRDYTLAASDRLVLAAQHYNDTAYTPRATAQHAPSQSPERGPVATPEVGSRLRRVLVLGWSHKVAPLVAELRYDEGAVELCLASSVSVERRRKELDRELGFGERPWLTLVEMDYTNGRELALLNPETFDNVVFISSDWATSGEASDARTIVGYLVLRRHLESHLSRPDILIELQDSENVSLLGSHPSDVLISPVLLSHMLAQVALRRELNAVFEELFAARGPEITLRNGLAYGLKGNPSFADMIEAAAARGETALGWLQFRSNGEVETHLNPARTEKINLGADDEIVVVA
jgi:hypothetical protein